MTNRLKRFVTFAYCQIFADSIFTSVIVYFTGGSNSIFTFIYFFPIISGGLLLFRRGSLSIAAFNTLCYGLILSSEYVTLASQLPDTIRHNPANITVILLQNFSVYCLSFFLAAMLSSFLAEKLQQTEEALSRTSRDYDILSRLYKQIFDDITSGIITVDSTGEITSINNAAEGITGYHNSEIIGKKINRIFPDLHQDVPIAAQERAVIDLICKDKKTIPVGYSWAKLNMPDDQKNSRIYTLQDLSKIKEMEEKVRQNEKMAAIGQIAAGIAHEFRNPLASISGAAQVLNQDKTNNSANKSLLNIIIRECTRLEENIGDFLQFSKPSIPEKQWTSIKGLVDESWSVIEHSTRFKNNCKLTTEIADNLDCWADHHQVKQILLNLLHNACLAMEKQGGVVHVSAKEQIDDKDQASILIEVSDNGNGIPEMLYKDIFAPFFTTRQNGTGLGLAIVKQIVEGHGGFIDLKSVINKGTIFAFTMPMPSLER